MTMLFQTILGKFSLERAEDLTLVLYSFSSDMFAAVDKAGHLLWLAKFPDGTEVKIEKVIWRKGSSFVLWQGDTLLGEHNVR